MTPDLNVIRRAAAERNNTPEDRRLFDLMAAAWIEELCDEVAGQRLAARSVAAELERLTMIIQDMAHELLAVENHCPCGARPESLDTHPHVTGCPVAKALDIWERAFVRGDG